MKSTKKKIAKLVQRALENLPEAGGSTDSHSSSRGVCKMRFGDGGNDVGGNGGLLAGQWSVDPDTGLIRLTEAAMARLMNPDPIEKWYMLDPEPLARYVLIPNSFCVHSCIDVFLGEFQYPRQVHVLPCSACVTNDRVRVSLHDATKSCHRCTRATCEWCLTHGGATSSVDKTDGSS